MLDNLQVRLSQRLLISLCGVERLAGQWQPKGIQESQAHSAQASRQYEANIAAAAVGALYLDSTTSADLSSIIPRTWSNPQQGLEFFASANSPLQSSQRIKPYPELDKYIAAHNLDAELTPKAIAETHRSIVGIADFPGQYRQESSALLSPSGAEIMKTTSAFMIAQRLGELCDWTRKELTSGLTHPLIVIGIFQLCFIYIYPFRVASHRLGLLLTWRLLKANGYEFVRYGHFIPEICCHTEDYVNALIQAEKSAYGNWTTLPVWLEYFSETLGRACRGIIEQDKQKKSKARLTEVQRLIVEIVQQKGAATRDTIAKETGINIATVKYNLSVLTQRGQLRRHGGGRTTSYSAC